VATERVERRLAAILAADVAGYSRLMGEDEEGTLARLKALRRELIDPEIAEHKGRIVKTTGDGILIEFPSVVEAVACALAVQRGMAARNGDTPDGQRIAFRVGINLGDIILDEGDIFGDGVNIAARLEALAEPGGICVSRIVRDQVRDRLDVAFEDIGEQALKNIARPVRVFRVTLTHPDAKAPGSPLSRNAGEGAKRQRREAGEGNSPALPLPDKPSIAVLPFQNMSGDPEQEYFADGMVEEIITALSRIRWLFVIARNSSFTYKGQAVDVKRVGRELGVRYVLEGSVRKDGNRVRITAQLIEAETGAHIWADRFDGSLEDIFDLQDKVALSVAGAIEPALETTEVRRSIGRPTKDLTAYDWYLRALPDCYSYSAEAQLRARDLLDQAIGRDPRFGPALARAAYCCFLLVFYGRSEDPAEDAARGIGYARRALAVAGNDPATLVHAAQALAYFGEDIGAMIALVDRALSLNPSFARGWHISGVLRRWAGQTDIGIEHVAISMRLSPRTRVGTPLFAIGQAHFLARRFEEAVPKLLLAIQDDPRYPEPHRVLAACYAHMGRLNDAQKIMARLHAITHTAIPDVSYLRNPEHRELYLSGLRLAMGETDEAPELSG
jgi:adenylate cyclase